jgi:hypothetical protein
MSNPPVPPSNPDGSEPGRPPAPGPDQEAPRYGEPAPQPPVYGQQPPVYGQQPPSAPQYGQQPPQAPQYGQAPSAPQYGQPPQAPRYGQVAPQLPQYGQQPYGQQPPQFGKSGYGQSPYAQYPSEQPSPPGEAHKRVNLAFWLLIASGAVWLLSVLLTIGLIDTPALRQQFEEQMAASGTQVDFNSIKGVIIGTIVVVAIIGAGLYALVAFNVRKGKNWARILGTVFAALSLLSLFPLGPGTLAAVLGIAGIVLLYLPDTSPYFQKRQPFANPYGQPGSPFGK